MEKDIQNHNNDEIEIDLVELFGELKKNWKLIVSTTVAFAAAAAIYSFCIAKPVYQYNAMIRIPANIINHSFVVNTSLELLKNDGVAIVTGIRNTSLLKLSFSAHSPNEAQLKANDYLPRAEAKVNEIIKDADGFFLDKIITAGVGGLVVAEKSDCIAKNTKVEVIRQDKGLKIPVSPNNKKNIAIATALGLFISCCYTIVKYLMKK